MIRKLKAKWIKALRGGQYRQGTWSLVDSSGEKFCCLGVLADIQGCEWMPDKGDLGMVPIRKDGRGIVNGSDDMLPTRRAGGLSKDAQEKLAQMNDDGASFKEIADHIEANL